VEALFRDLLIGVTSFFRDPQAFQALEDQIIPKCFAVRKANAVRVWVPGCSTGEEAYSIAILLAERQEALKQRFEVQVFATDIDGQAIAAARTGLYPASIRADISPERLARFFGIESNGSAYRIHKAIRDVLIFSEQNVIKDPPFSKVDLISCRNLLIYMGGELQKKVIPLFHYALNPGGSLFLGTSETVGEFVDLFATLDRKLKLYQRRDDSPNTQRAAPGWFVPPTMAIAAAIPRALGKTVGPGNLALRELTEQALLQHVAPAGALVDRHGNILYLHGRTGQYLEPTPGESVVSNILKMAREGLQRALTTALRKAAGTKEVVYDRGLRIKTNGGFTTVNLTIRRVATGSSATPAELLYVVILEDAPASAVDQTARHTDGLAGANTPAGFSAGTSTELSAGSAGTDADTSTGLTSTELSEGSAGGFDVLTARARIAALTTELRAKEEHLQTANEELETSNEELTSSNEEMQSVNEELQSTNEELETSKEELQSVNEELATVNAELQTKVTDLSRANNDVNNLLAGTGIGTVFVDHQLRILRFTPAVSRIINLILSDVGRPVGHVVSNLVGYDRLVADVQSVLDTLVPKEVDVQTLEGEWYTLRIMPYRTMDNVIEGAVVTFVDITKIVLARETLRRLTVIVDDARDAITVQDLEGRILAWNQGAVRMYGWSEAEALVMNVRDRIPEGLREEALAAVLRLSRAEVMEPYHTQRITKDGVVADVSMISTALVNEAGHVYAIATTERAGESQVD